MSKIPENLANDIAAKIDNESFDYWLREGYAFSQLKDYPKLMELAGKAKKAMDTFENALEDAGVEQL